MGLSCSTSGNSSSSNALTAPSGDVSPALLDLLGPTLISGAGEVPTSTALAGKSVALYFSAHWCPPCRGFTPQLAESYTKHLKNKDLEIVFISSDRDQKSADAYFAGQPWLALPFSDRARKSALGTRYDVSGIPCLVLINEQGELITKDGRANVAKDPTGKWVPRAPEKKLSPVQQPSNPAGAGLASLIGNAPLLDVDGRREITLPELVKDAPLVALYFSAHWCGPCRAFTPKLAAFVKELEKAGNRLPVIFGSSDHDEGSFQSYFADMPWFAFPFGDARIEALKSKFKADGIPWLVLLDAQGNLVLNEADTDVPKGPAVYSKWLSAARKATAGAPAA